MKKLTAIILAIFCLLNLTACFPVDPGYGNTVAYAGWSDDPSISEGALNKDTLTDLCVFAHVCVCVCVIHTHTRVYTHTCMDLYIHRNILPLVFDP